VSLRRAERRLGPKDERLVREGACARAVSDGERDRRHGRGDVAAFGYVDAFKGHVNVGFFFGALLKDPARLLEGTGKRGRHVKLRPRREVDSAALAQLVDAAYVDIGARLGK
jgi:hypothetical protein